MGFSDNTNMTFLLATLCDTASIYGPCAAAFGMEPWHESLWDAYHLLRGEKSSIEEKQKNNVQYKPLVQPAEELQEEITMQGRLLGGCMDCLVNLLGTEFDKVQEFTEKYQDDGIIWFLESCDLNVMSIRRAVWQMKHAGWFSHVKDGIRPVPCGYRPACRVSGTGHYGCGYRTYPTDDAACLRKLCGHQCQWKCVESKYAVEIDFPQIIK